MSKHIIYLGMLLWMAISLTACHNGPKEIDAAIVNIPVSAEGETDNSKMPVISFDKLSHDFGNLMQGEKVSYTYHFTNTGKSPLVISSVVPSCGCTVAQFTKTPVMPGDKGDVSINFNTETKHGMISSGVTVQANTYPSETRLTFTAIVETK
ncbi:MAG: DUF1573 domain-containing protein [Bacteroidales bacterium]|nr:DUF1573 domain-containing protein [Bacteroidales bacterium]